MNPQKSELDKLINAAIEITEQAQFSELEQALNPIKGDFGLLTSPIIAGFWGQEDSLKALSDYLNENPSYYNSTTPGLFVESIIAFNSAQQYSCNTALQVGLELNNCNKQRREKTLNTSAIKKALILSLKLGLILGSIKSALKRGFSCQ